MIRLRRVFSTSLWRFSLRNFTNVAQTEEEHKLANILRLRFPDANHIQVNDVSHGCGAMYEIYVVTQEFEGLSKVKQHMLINETLKDEIKNMHGLRIATAAKLST